MIIPDLNLLVYAFNASAPHHAAAARWWENLLNSRSFVGVPWVVYVGFLRLMTGRHVLLEPYTTEEALNITAEWLAIPSVSLLQPSKRTHEALREIVQTHGLCGAMISDAVIAAMALEYGAVLHTNDTDFARFAHLQTHNPLLD